MKRMSLDRLNWSELISKIGVTEVNKELDKHFLSIFETLRDLTSVYISDASLTEHIKSLKTKWLPARDQYERAVIHLALLNGNTLLVRCLVHSGCPINIRDGIGQTALTLALYMGHTINTKFMVESGASVRDSLFPNTVPPLEIAKIKEDTIMVYLIENKIWEEENIIKHVGSFFHGHDDHKDEMETKDSDGNYARALNINVGDQKNTILIQGCSNRCPKVYGCHTPGGGDFHNCSYVNECIA